MKKKISLKKFKKSINCSSLDFNEKREKYTCKKSGKKKKSNYRNAYCNDIQTLVVMPEENYKMMISATDEERKSFRWIVTELDSIEIKDKKTKKKSNWTKFIISMPTARKTVSF